MKIGQYDLENQVLVAPMAGVTDSVYRQSALDYGAAMAVSEMVSANAILYGSSKTRWRLSQPDNAQIKSVQIVGHDPEMMAQAAKINTDLGAQIIDINMGCPAKKVCNKLAGSALLADEDQVKRILDTVVNAIDAPVTLKIRTGTDVENRNGVRIAQIAHNSGIEALSVHGRTRACRFKGEAEYQTIRQIKASVAIPVIANGDIDSPEKAAYVLKMTQADAIMIGRAAQGKPWLFKQVINYLRSGIKFVDPSVEQIGQQLLNVLDQMYLLYGEYSGVRIARKHISWYTKGLELSNEFRRAVNQLESSAAQYKLTRDYFLVLGSELKQAA